MQQKLFIGAGINLSRSTDNLIAYWRTRRQGLPGQPLGLEGLCELTGIDRKTLFNYENGKVIPKAKHLFLIAAALDVPPHVLYAQLWRKVREDMADKRREVGFGKAYPGQ